MNSLINNIMNTIIKYMCIYGYDIAKFLCMTSLAIGISAVGYVGFHEKSTALMITCAIMLAATVIVWMADQKSNT